MLAGLYVIGRVLNARRAKRHRRGILKQIVTPIWRLSAWLADRYAVPGYAHRALVLSDDFYSSPQWAKVRSCRFMINRITHGGRLKCEVATCTNPYGAAEYHCHHWNPRSTHPEDALKLGNTGIACRRCNRALGNRYVGRDLRPNPRLA